MAKGVGWKVPAQGRRVREHGGKVANREDEQDKGKAKARGKGGQSNEERKGTKEKRAAVKAVREQSAGVDARCWQVKGKMW